MSLIKEGIARDVTESALLDLGGVLERLGLVKVSEFLGRPNYCPHLNPIGEILLGLRGPTSCISESPIFFGVQDACQVSASKSVPSYSKTGDGVAVGDGLGWEETTVGTVAMGVMTGESLHLPQEISSVATVTRNRARSDDRTFKEPPPQRRVDFGTWGRSRRPTYVTEEEGMNMACHSQRAYVEAKIAVGRVVTVLGRG